MEIVDKNINRKGLMFVLSSPSGAGKTSLSRKILEIDDEIFLSISYTTRPSRPGEVDGKDYFFVDNKIFSEMRDNNEFLEYAKVFDYYYGTRKQPVTDKLIKGKDVLFDIDWQGTKQLKKIKELSLVTFFILPPNLKILKERLINRHEGQEKLIEKRMEKFEEEVSHWNEYNYVVVNDDLDICYNKILSIIKSEKNGISEKINFDEIKKRVQELVK